MPLVYRDDSGFKNRGFIVEDPSTGRFVLDERRGKVRTIFNKERSTLPRPSWCSRSCKSAGRGRGQWPSVRVKFQPERLLHMNDADGVRGVEKGCLTTNIHAAGSVVAETADEGPILLRVFFTTATNKGASADAARSHRFPDSPRRLGAYSCAFTPAVVALTFHGRSAVRRTGLIVGGRLHTSLVCRHRCNHVFLVLREPLRYEETAADAAATTVSGPSRLPTGYGGRNIDVVKVWRFHTSMDAVTSRALPDCSRGVRAACSAALRSSLPFDQDPSGRHSSEANTEARWRRADEYYLGDETGWRAPRASALTGACSAVGRAPFDGATLHANRLRAVVKRQTGPGLRGETMPDNDDADSPATVDYPDFTALLVCNGLVNACELTATFLLTAAAACSCSAAACLAFGGKLWTAHERLRRLRPTAARWFGGR